MVERGITGQGACMCMPVFGHRKCLIPVRFRAIPLFAPLLTEVVLEDTDRYPNVKAMRSRRRTKKATKKETGGCGLPLARLKADRAPVIVVFTEH